MPLDLDVELEWFIGLSSDERARFLARLSHNLTIVRQQLEQAGVFSRARPGG